MGWQCGVPNTREGCGASANTIQTNNESGVHLLESLLFKAPSIENTLVLNLKLHFRNVPFAEPFS